MEIRIYNKNNKRDFYQHLLEMDVHLDVYYNPEFLDLDAENQNGKFEIFTVIDNKECFIYPYIKLPFEDSFESYYDIASPYGYCGPFATSDSIFEKGEEAFLDYARQNNIVTEFIRYHFLYNSNRRFQMATQNLQNRKVVLLNLMQDWDEIWMKEFSGTNRNLVRKLEKEKFEYSISSKPSENELKDFIELYNSTMVNANADEFYFFSENYYFSLFKKLDSKVFLANVKKNNVLYASALFFIENGIANYYLSARNLTYGKVPSGNFLLSQTVKWAKEYGCEYFNFGGGTTNADDNFLYKYKRNFSKNIVDFYIGKRIHDVKAYDAIKSVYIQKVGIEKFDQVKHILQFYRQ